MTDSLHHTFAIPESLSGQRLDKALAELAAQNGLALSRARLQGLMEEGNLSKAGTVVTGGSVKVKAGETFILTLPPPEPAEPEAQAMDLDIVYEDADVIVINKPAGLVVHPAPGNRDQTLVNALLAHCGASLSGIGGVARPGIVHRLDKDTSGLMVVAKNDKAHHALSAQFAGRSLSRTYRAVVWGVPLYREATIDASIARHAKDRKKMAVTNKGKTAITHYKVIEEYGLFSLVECTLETGRTHQIRVHMAHIKHPVVGDPVYGRKGALPKAANIKAVRDFKRQALHALRLSFIHPTTGKTVKFSCKMPADMNKLIKALGKLDNGYDDCYNDD